MTVLNGAKKKKKKEKKAGLLASLENGFHPPPPPQYPDNMCLYLLFCKFSNAGVHYFGVFFQ